MRDEERGTRESGKGDRMKTIVTEPEARRHLPALISRAARHRERVILTFRGRPQAALVPLSDLRVLEMFAGGQSALSREWPAFLAAMEALQEALHGDDRERAKELAEEIDDFLAAIAVAGEPTRPWEDFARELEGDVPATHPA